MSPEQRAEIAEYVQGTCMTLGAVIEHFDLDLSDDDLEDELLTANMELCPGCGWWMESSELLNDASEVVGCEQCREPEDE